jgi:hypothetical protein
LTYNFSRPTDEILDTEADICAIEERNLFPVEDVEDGAIFAAEMEAIDLSACRDASQMGLPEIFLEFSSKDVRLFALD